MKVFIDLMKKHLGGIVITPENAGGSSLHRQHELDFSAKSPDATAGRR